MPRCTGMAILPKLGGVPIFLPAQAETKHASPIKISCLFIILLLLNGLFLPFCLFNIQNKAIKIGVNI